MVQLGMELFEWEDLEDYKKKCTYWVAVPKDLDCYDGADYEIVYVYFDGKWSVARPGQQGNEPLKNFWFAYQVGLPQT